MTLIEMSLLIVGLSVVAFVAVQAVYGDLAFGLRYGASARDEERSDVLSRRLGRVVRNQVEGVAMFAPLALLADGGGTGGGESGVMTIFCLFYAVSRPLHALLQATGVGWPRSVVWLLGFGALLLGYAQAALT
jgi:uncharacterized MAPEG superfamily protein